MTHTLENIIQKYGVPDSSIVGKLPRGNVQLDFVGHAEITKILIEVDTLWSWEPVAWNEGRPAIVEVNGMAVMWARLTVLNKTILGVGSCKSDKPELDKELVGDFLRNAAMRFGICLSLWSKAEWEDSKQPSSVTRTRMPSSPSSDKVRYISDSIEEAASNDGITELQIKKVAMLRKELNIQETVWREKLKTLYNTDSVTTLSKARASDLIDKLNKAVVAKS